MSKNQPEIIPCVQDFGKNWLFTAHDDFDSGNPSACHIWTKLNELSEFNKSGSVDREPASCLGFKGSIPAFRGLFHYSPWFQRIIV